MLLKKYRKKGRVYVKTRKKWSRATGRHYGKESILENENGKTISNFLKNPFWKRLRPCLKTDYVMNE